METTLIRYVHGWGSGPVIWDQLIKALPEYHHETINLGFTGDKQIPDLESRAIYVTHSLGTMWALRQAANSMEALIVINGFTCFENFASPQALKAMKINLRRNPEQQMNDFASRSALPVNKTYNTEALKEGLNWLLEWNEANQMKSLECPVTTLIAQDDKILDFDQMQEHWRDYDAHVFEEGGHALPLQNPGACAKIIKEVVNDL